MSVASATKASVQRLMTLAVAIAMVACGGDGGSTGPNGGGGNGQFRFSAKIDGANWASTAGVEAVGVPVSVPGIFALTGSQPGGQTIIITLYNIPGPGTYPLGTGVSVPGGNALISTTAGGWRTAQSGADGTITITTLTATRMEGTFNFTAVAFTGGATGTKTVTDGSFVLELKPTGTIGPLPDNAGHKVSATLNGASFNAADVAMIYSPGGSSFTVTGNTNTRSVTFALANITGPGTFALSTTNPIRSMGATVINGTQVVSLHNSAFAGSSGSVTITSLTATRIRGTFNAVLAAAPGSAGTMTITNGTFDVGRLQ
jgi:hypothetical protein